MAKIRSGVLGNTRGKVAGVVGSQWKNVNYLREYVKPANPNTAAQQVQRTKMSDTVEFCKALVGPIFNAYTDKFQKGMSGFNYFIKQNIDIFDGSPDYSLVKITEGKLSAVGQQTSTYNSSTGETIVNWSKNLGNNGLDDDAIFISILDQASGLWLFSSVEVERVDETETLTLPTGLVTAFLACYIVCAQYSGTIVSSIADSTYTTLGAP